MLEGKTAVVTGGTRGIGFAIARALLEAGADIAICGRSRSGIDRAIQKLNNAGGSRVIGFAADVRYREQVSAFFDFISREFGRVDILVNNAGVGIFRPVAELSFEDWHTVLDTNLSGVFYCCRAALPLMMRGGGGSVINISSLAGKNPFAGGAAYNASKFGLNGFTEAMMMDHRKDNIRMTYIMPGSVATEFGRGGVAESWKIAPEDVAEVVVAVLRMPSRTLISRVEIRPSRPPT
ncbi:MAG TPA: SDR family oxidoreductase [Bryobacteraceae bacterium]|nr:SDR family oxidoreductase [Bryobacteraceae bacterium]